MMNCHLPLAFQSTSLPSTARTFPLKGCLKPRKYVLGRRSDLKGARSKFLAAEEEGAESSTEVATGQGTESRLPKQPKFQPFVGESETQRAIVEYQHEMDVADGSLHISVLREGHIPAATELLATNFADTIGYLPMYRSLLKQEVEKYLYSHLRIAPKAVILVAMLKPLIEEELGSATKDATGSLITALQSNAEARQAGVEAPETVPGPNPLQPSLPFSSKIQEAVEKLESTSGDRDAEQAAERSSLGSEDYTALDADFFSRAGRGEGSQGSDTGSDSQPAGDAPEPSKEWQARRRGEGELEQQMPGALVGTVELSFSSSTRTPALTLNPPQDSAYLCNMAVAEKFQRRGYGTCLLSAAQDVVRLAGFRRVYLHVRIHDGAAKALYSKAGFEFEKEDCLLVSLWDKRRQLLSKFLPREDFETKPDMEPIAEQQTEAEF